MREGETIEYRKVQIAPLPDILAKDFVRNRDDFGQESSVVHEGDRSKIYRVFRREEDIPGIGEVTLVLDYRNYHDEKN